MAGPTTSLTPSIFISYVSSDREIAERLRSHLARCGLRTFDGSLLTAGSNWRAEIQQGINSANACIFLISKSALEREGVYTEVAAAVAAQAHDPSKRIIPVLLARGIDLPPLLSSYQWIDTSDYPSLDDAFEDTARTLKTEAVDPIDREGIRLALDNLEVEAWSLRNMVSRELIEPPRRYFYWLFAMTALTGALFGIVINQASLGMGRAIEAATTLFALAFSGYGVYTTRTLRSGKTSEKTNDGPTSDE
jgi:hypothetical protein